MQVWQGFFIQNPKIRVELPLAAWSKLMSFRPKILCLVSLFFLWSSLPLYGGEAVSPDYQALSLENCLTIARKENPALGASREKVQELVADYQAARSQFFPRLTLLSYFTRQPADRFVSGGLPPPNLFTKELSGAITGKQILFSGLKNYHNTLAAKQGTEAQKQEVQRTSDEVAYSVTEVFYRLLEAKENLKVAQEALSQRQQFAKLSDAFFRAGKVTHLDSFRAQSQVSEADQAVAEAQTAVRLAKQILIRTLGLKEDAKVDIRGRLPQEFTDAGDVDSLWQGALKNNPELKRLDLQLAQSQALVKAARSGYFPEVSLQGATDVRHRDQASTGGNLTREEYLYGVFLEFPFFKGGLTRAQVAKAASQNRQLLEAKRDRLDSLKADLTSAWKNQEDARHGVTNTRQTVATNEEAFASSQALYRVGKVIGLEVLQSQVDLTASRFQLIRYAVAYEIGKARVKQITGSDQNEFTQQGTNGGQKK
jgi:outer membrane protein